MTCSLLGAAGAWDMVHACKHVANEPMSPVTLRLPPWVPRPLPEGLSDVLSLDFLTPDSPHPSLDQMLGSPQSQMSQLHCPLSTTCFSRATECVCAGWVGKRLLSSPVGRKIHLATHGFKDGYRSLVCDGKRDGNHGHHRGCWEGIYGGWRDPASRSERNRVPQIPAWKPRPLTVMVLKVETLEGI